MPCHADPISVLDEPASSYEGCARSTREKLNSSVHLLSLDTLSSEPEVQATCSCSQGMSVVTACLLRAQLLTPYLRYLAVELVETQFIYMF